MYRRDTKDLLGKSYQQVFRMYFFRPDLLGVHHFRNKLSQSRCGIRPSRRWFHLQIIRHKQCLDTVQ